MSKVMMPWEVVAKDCKENMTARNADRVIALAILAVEYLERKAKDSVNLDYDAQAVNRKEGKDVDASDIFVSHRDKVKVSKAIKMMNDARKFGEEVIKHEDKLAALEGEKVEEAPALPAPATK